MNGQMKPTLAIMIGIILLMSEAKAQRQAEKLNRGMVAVSQSGGKVYLGWRLLKTDPANIAFNVYRSTAGGDAVKLNREPIADTTNFGDEKPPLDRANAWWVKPVINGRELEASERAELPANPPERNYLSIALQGNYGFNKMAVADLDGDGVYDYVIKQPRGGLDPGTVNPSPDTYKVEAYNGKTGRFMWRYDLGWNLNMGIWWTPMIVYDFDGDGKAEIALKTAPYAATREASFIATNGPAAGFVLDGPEYCSVLDGMTGKEIARVDWVARGNPQDWGDDRGNRVNRNQIGVAYLDGKRPSLLVCRGTYTKMLVHAYNLIDGKLEPVWKWNGDDENPRVRGQGSHGIHVADVDGDGRDEIILGSVVLDDNGKKLWGNGMGHPDITYVADIIPDRPGLEIAFGYESRAQKNGMHVADARTGEIIWGHPIPTTHIHDQGMLADVDPSNPGLEFYGAEKDKPDRWTYAALTGKLLSTNSLNTISPRAFYWLDGPIKVYSPFNYRSAGNAILKYNGPQVGELPGQILVIADVLGDWREELICSMNGELRIYTTTVPATSRHVCLMQDPLYRMDVAHVSMGYFYPPQLSYDFGDGKNDSRPRSQIR